MPKSRNRPPARGIPSQQDIKIAFTPVELRFLIQALRDVPLTGKPDLLVQLLPIVQRLRLKVASATAVFASTQAPAPPEEKPAEAPAQEPSTE